MMDRYTTFYIIAVNVIAFLIYFILKKNISKVEDRRVEELEDLDQFSPIQTKSPLKKPISTARKKALKNLDSRFTIIRRIFLLVLFLIWAVALSAPFLGNFSKQFLSLIITAFSVILGIAARPYIENIISGIVISFSRKLNTGDTILIDDHYGTVEDITLTHTSVKIWDWRRYIIPNSLMLQKEFINYTIHDEDQWAYVIFNVSPDADFEVVKDIAVQAAQENRLILGYEKPRFWIMHIGKDSIECWLAAWSKYYDAWTMKSEIRTEICIRLQKAGIRTHTFTIEDGSIRTKQS